ncbi:MAG: GH25 family lysozyme [Eubacteriales bacterium]|nr:GH25 family lysozyme [Eubacteriales bacterium]
MNNIKKIKKWSIAVCYILFTIIAVLVSGNDANAANKKAWQKINGVCYNGSGVPIRGAILRGMDISEWNHVIDWAQLSKSIDFGYVRISYGTGYLDKYYDYNMRKANAYKVPVGTYVYSRALTKQEALKEAQLAISKMQGYTISYPVAFDLEYAQIKNKLTKRQIAELALTFCTEVKKAGYYPMIYCNTNWYSNYIDWSILSGINVWLASYSDTSLAPTTTKYKYTTWQSTDGDGGGTLNPTKGLFAGINPSLNVDVDFGYVDYTKRILPRRYSDPNYVPTPIRSDGWVTVGSNTYYYRDGVLLKGQQAINRKWYYFDPATGELYKNRLFSPKGRTHLLFAQNDGSYAKNKWVTYNKKKYYIGSDYRPISGLKVLDKKYYYFHKTQFYMLTNRKMVKSNGGIIYFGRDGACVRNAFQTINENGSYYTYYFGSRYDALKGWQKINGKLYYFSRGTARMLQNTEVTNSAGITYVFDANGVMIKKY